MGTYKKILEERGKQNEKYVTISEEINETSTFCHDTKEQLRTSKKIIKMRNITKRDIEKFKSSDCPLNKINEVK